MRRLDLIGGRPYVRWRAYVAALEELNFFHVNQNIRPASWTRFTQCGRWPQLPSASSPFKTTSRPRMTSGPRAATFGSVTSASARASSAGG